MAQFLKFIFVLLFSMAFGQISVKEFGAVGDGVTNDTKAIQQALNSGKPIKFEQGVYLVDELTVPYSFKGLTIDGSGYNHWHNNVGTVLKANKKALSILKFVDGCDWVKISNLRLDGGESCPIGINAEYGGALMLENIGVYNFTTFGMKSQQGLLRINNCFFGNNKVGVQLYSDSTITNTEISGGSIGLFIRAGGNRINNIWVNGTTENLIRMEPLNESVGLQNTAFSNIYIGEVKNNTSTEKYQFYIKGNSIKRVQQIQISNSFFVHATDTAGANSFFYLENADEIIISNNNFLGEHVYSNKQKFTKNLIKSLNSNNIKINSNIIKGINENAIAIADKSYDWSILNNDFIDCAGQNNANSIINIQTKDARTMILNNRFIDYRQNTNVVALKTVNMNSITFNGNYIYYPNPKIAVDENLNSINITGNFR